MKNIQLLDQVRNLLSHRIAEVRNQVVAIPACAIVPGKLAMIAVRSNDPLLDPVRACIGCNCRRALAVKEVVFVLWDAIPERFIANAMCHVDVRRVVIVRDPDIDGLVAKVVVDESQFGEAVGPESVFPRAAAMLTQVDIEIVFAGVGRAV
jgi:transcription termination/antitermination protein NusA